MKKILFILLAFVSMSVSAQTPQQMLDKAVNALKGTVTADYMLKSDQGAMKGTVVVNGKKFRMLSKDVKTWYDGNTQWIYSVATHEVNITTPTPQELQMTNPVAAAQGFKKGYNMWKAAGQVSDKYAIMLQPKSKSDIKKVYLYISNGSNLLHSANFQMNDGTSFTITMSNYKTKVSVPESTFQYDASMVPAGTQVVDLR
ncbi:LolA family protein [Sodaliphilus sp.]|uniref:LolA family protein n=1 Tax=Sodaliphilus sp. TaxID=2815818 RepID=UPI00388E4917